MQNQLKHVYRSFTRGVYPAIRAWVFFLIRYAAFEVDPFWIYLSYFVTLSFAGYVGLKSLSSAGRSSSYEDLDIFFTSLSALTESSLTTIEMEMLSTSQLVVLGVLMIVGGEVFTSLIVLFYRKSKFARMAAGGGGDDHDNDKFSKSPKTNDDVPEHVSPINNLVNVVNGYKMISVPGSPTTSEGGAPPESPPTVIAAVDTPVAVVHRHDHFVSVDLHQNSSSIVDPADVVNTTTTTTRRMDLIPPPADILKHKSIQCLASIILIYLIGMHVIGISFISLYLAVSSRATNVLTSKGLSLPAFSIFVTVSTFANCGFLPNNENMIAFKHNCGLQLMLIPLILCGNCLYPCCLRLMVWFLERVTKRDDYGYLLRNHDELGFPHLLSGLKCYMMAATTFAFILLQFLLMCVMEWTSESLQGLNSFEKLIGLFFQAINTRYTGENVVDLSLFSPAVLVLIVALMHLPPYYMWYLPKRQRQSAAATKSTSTSRSDPNHPSRKHSQRIRSTILEKYLTFNSLFYLVSFTILICIVERHSFREDPVNFNVFNVVFEVVSGYGNVGYSLGYSCKRRLKYDPNCRDYSYSFVGRWSRLGKFILAIVMMYGRMKRFSKHGSQGRRYKSYYS